MKHYTITPPTYRQPGDDSISRVQEFELVDAKKVRHGGHGSTDAWELTFRIPSGLKFSAAQLQAADIKQENIAAGMQIALYGVNDDERVEKALNALESRPEGEMSLPLPARDGPKTEPQPMGAATAIAHTLDLTRPTPQLLEKCGITSREHQYDDMPVEDFLQQPGIKGRLTFDQFRLRQPPLQNRKYTPSGVNVADGTISILVSEVHHTVKATGQDSQGTTTGYLRSLAERFLKGERGLTVHGLLDVRKHKLPYQDATGPRIFLSTGVGIAPHIAWLRQCRAEGRDPNVALMLSGERNESDHLLADEIERDISPGVLEHVYSSPASGIRQYVGDALLNHADCVWHTLHDKHGTLYMCGHEGMKAGVKAALITIASQRLPADEVAPWVEGLFAKGSAQVKESLSWPDRFYQEKWPKIWESRKEEVARLEGEGRQQG